MPSNVNSSRAIQLESAPTLSGTSQADAASAMGQMIQEMPSFGSEFVQGMKIGYTGVTMTLSPFLAYRGAKIEKEILGLQADLLDMQVQSIQTQAEDVMRAGHQASAAVSYQAGQAKSSARASMGASGVRVNAAGSSAEALSSIDIVKDMQRSQIMANAVAQSWGYRRQAVQVQNQALAVRSAQKNVSPWAAAITTHLSDVMDSMNQMGDMFGGGQGGGLSGETFKNAGSFFSNIFGG